jgi:hypothetical protein
MQEISIYDLKKAQKNAGEKAIKIDRALGLAYHIVRKGPDGTEKEIKKAKFGYRKIIQKEIDLKNV